MKPSLGVMFGGGGVGSIGLEMAGLQPIWSIEYSEEIAAYHRLNVPGECIVADVSDADYSQLKGVDFLWASPSCVNASVANANAGETEADRQAARAVARAIREVKPRWFALENVLAYRHFDSFKLICDALAAAGFWFTWESVDFSTIGVPQTRRRLILRATQDGLLRALPGPTGRIGWYEAIEDLIPTLPDSAFAPWQLARLPQGWDSGAYLIGRQTGTGNDALQVRSESEPANTITQHEAKQTRAFIVDCMDNPSGKLTLREQEEPAFTISGGSGVRRPARASIRGGRVVAMSPRALARFQSLPDSYVLPEKKSLACRIVGNGCPTLGAKVIAESLIGELK